MRTQVGGHTRLPRNTVNSSFLHDAITGKQTKRAPIRLCETRHTLKATHGWARMHAFSVGFGESVLLTYRPPVPLAGEVSSDLLVPRGN